ncbi:hypothetical protein [Undibacterium danionis]|uniref:Uncharacterized protein n=1 Tax=Undibacterium danionis TaxID=1812100 RepID=A0ABV6IBD8_9BURK
MKNKNILIAITLIAAGFTSPVFAQTNCPIKIDSTFDCAKYLEQEIRKKYPNRVRRVGNTLEIKPSAGPAKIFKNIDSDSDDFRSYQLIKYFADVDYSLLVTTYYEGGTYELIDMKTGKLTNVGGDAVLSPDQQRIAVAHADIEAGYAPNVLSVYLITPSGLIKELDLRPNDWGAEDLNWESNSSISFNRRHWKKDEIVKTKHKLQFQGKDIKMQGKWLADVKLPL